MLRVVATIARRPSLWPIALRQARRTIAPGWWRRRPYVPIPPAEYMRFRLVTQYGDEGATPGTDDVVKYLRWCREWERGATGAQS